MARYIDAEMLEREIKLEASDDIARAVIRIIDRQPTADVVEVVRCEYCRKTLPGEGITGNKFCLVHEVGVPKDYYCASGERKNAK